LVAVVVLSLDRRRGGGLDRRWASGLDGEVREKDSGSAASVDRKRLGTHRQCRVGGLRREGEGRQVKRSGGKSTEEMTHRALLSTGAGTRRLGGL
jgi:hypothetical protein